MMRPLPDDIRPLPATGVESMAVHARLSQALHRDVARLDRDFPHGTFWRALDALAVGLTGGFPDECRR